MKPKLFHAALFSAALSAAGVLAQDAPFPAYEPVGPETGIAGSATGFFHVENIGGADWIVDPVGRATLVNGIDHVRPASWKDRDLGYDVYKAFVETNYPSTEAWAAETVERLRDWGFNVLASQCTEPLVRHRGLAHTLTLYLGGRFAAAGGKDPDRWITPWSGPCTGMPNVFHPDFADAVRADAMRQCAPNRDNPWLLGYFLDNELKWWGPNVSRQDLGLVDAIRALPAGHSARKALEGFLAGRPLDDGLRAGFLRLFAEKYFTVLCDAVREADPNHLVLGGRFVGPFSNVHDIVYEVAGGRCDVVSMNLYAWADLDRGVVLNNRGGEPIATLFERIHGKCGRPLMITEWSFPALDAGLPCLYGAGQRFRTQRERAEATALFARTILSLPFFVGHDYFMFLDQPASGIAETFREDSNYGLVNNAGVPYPEITAALAEVQRDPARWRAAPPPGVARFLADKASGALYAPQAAPSERDLFFADAAAAARKRPDAAPATFAKTAGEGGRDSWTLSNGLVALSGREGGESAADAISFGGEEPVGRLGLLVEWRRADGASAWTHATLGATAEADPSAPDGAAAVLLRAAGDAGDGVRFAVAARATLAPGVPSALLEIVSVENLGDAPLEMQGAYLMPFSLAEKPEAARIVPTLWKAPQEGWWKIPGGGEWGLVSRDDAASFNLRVFPDGSQHPDARFFPRPRPCSVAPGATWRPDVPMGAKLLRRDK